MTEIKYRLIVERKEDNPNYGVEIAKWEDRNRFGNGYGRDMMMSDRNGMIRNLDCPEKMITSDALIIELTEAQFIKIKHEALKTFE